jgi:hypothetical protein
MKRIASLSLAIVGLSAGVLTAPPALADDTCLTPRLVSSWQNLGRHAIIVKAVGGRRWRLDLAGDCQGIENIVTMSVTSHGACVEQGDFVHYRYHQLGPQQCLITAVTPYSAGQTPDEPRNESGD